MSHELLRRSAIWLSWVPVAVTLSQAVGNVILVDGTSMQPSLNPDASLGWRDMIFLQKWGFRAGKNLGLGDVVVLRSPEDPDKILVKRIVAIGGDCVTPRPSSMYPRAQLKIPQNHFWVEGDNIHSVDSNRFGPVSAGLVMGKAVAVVFPPSRIGTIPDGGRIAKVQTRPESAIKT
jgi:inner membrane protease subunit 2